jgi:BNR/Asp-box repeat
MERFRLLLVPALAASLSAPYALSQTLPPPPGAQITSLTAQPGTYSEPGVAVNPLNPRQVVVVFQDNANASYSEDGGRTWQLATGVTPTTYKVSGDVSVAFDNKGHAILDCIAFDKLGTYNYWGHGATRNGIFQRRSLDGGKTWEPELRTVAAQPSTPGIPFEDKPYIVADTTHSRYAGNLYVGWTRWTLTDSQMLFSRSTDDGISWSKPIEISKERGLPRDDNGALEGFDGAVGPDGTIYAVWAANNRLVFTTSHDGGKSFARTRTIVETAPTMFAVSGMDRANGFPQIAIDPRGGAKGGPLYVTWSDYRNGEVDIFAIVSTDHGRTWSAPIKVNDDPVHDGAEHFFQWLAVDPVSGAVNVVFYDRRLDPTNRTQIVVLARSTDGGKTYKNYAWTDKPFNPDGVFMGDYLGLAAYGNKVYGAWPVKPGAEAKTTLQVGVADFNLSQ